MEALLASSQEQEPLVGPLAYGLDPSASYVQARRQSTTFSNVNSASPDGVKTITLTMGSASEWLDPTTALLSMLITETSGANALFPATPGAECLFDRFQLYLGSTLVEDIQEFGKLSHIMHQLSMSPQKRLDQGHLGFGTQGATGDNSYFNTSNHDARTIAAGGSKRIYMKFDLSGVFSQSKWLPLFALGGQSCRIQLSVAPGAQSMILSDSGVTYSSQFTLSDIRLLADFCSLSGELQESYNSALLSGTALKIPIKSWECMTSYLAADNGGSFDVAISKNYTRLATLFSVFNQNPPADNGTKTKIVNTSYFPGGAAIENLQYALHLGSRRIPDNDVRGTGEAWYRLQNCLGLYNSLAHSTNVDQDAYTSTAHCLGIDCERMPMVSASGENLSTGQTIFLKVKGMVGATSADIPRRATVCAHFESIISISDTVVDLYT